MPRHGHRHRGELGGLSRRELRHHQSRGLQRHPACRHQRTAKTSRLALRDQLHRQQRRQPHAAAIAKRSPGPGHAGGGLPHPSHGRLQQECLRRQPVWRGPGGPSTLPHPRRPAHGRADEREQSATSNTTTSTTSASKHRTAVPSTPAVATGSAAAAASGATI
jgi:hypothetical protein